MESHVPQATDVPLSPEHLRQFHEALDALIRGLHDASRAAPGYEGRPDEMATLDARITEVYELAGRPELALPEAMDEILGRLTAVGYVILRLLDRFDPDDVRYLRQDLHAMEEDLMSFWPGTDTARLAGEFRLYWLNPFVAYLDEHAERAHRAAEHLQPAYGDPADGLREWDHVPLLAADHLAAAFPVASEPAWVDSAVMYQDPWGSSGLYVDPQTEAAAPIERRNPAAADEAAMTWLWSVAHQNEHTVSAAAPGDPLVWGLVANSAGTVLIVASANSIGSTSISSASAAEANTVFRGSAVVARTGNRRRGYRTEVRLDGFPLEPEYRRWVQDYTGNWQARVLLGTPGPNANA